MKLHSRPKMWVHIHKVAGAWLAEVIDSEPLPHVVNLPRPRPTWSQATEDADRDWKVLA